MQSKAYELLRAHNHAMIASKQALYKLLHYVVYIDVIDPYTKAVQWRAVIALLEKTHLTRTQVNRSVMSWGGVYAPARLLRYEVRHTAKIAVERMFTFDQFMVVYSEDSPRLTFLAEHS